MPLPLGAPGAAATSQLAGWWWCSDLTLRLLPTASDPRRVNRPAIAARTDHAPAAPPSPLGHGTRSRSPAPGRRYVTRTFWKGPYPMGARSFYDTVVLKTTGCDGRAGAPEMSPRTAINGSEVNRYQGHWRMSRWRDANRGPVSNGPVGVARSRMLKTPSRGWQSLHGASPALGRDHQPAPTRLKKSVCTLDRPPHWPSRYPEMAALQVMAGSFVVGNTVRFTLPGPA